MPNESKLYTHSNSYSPCTFSLIKYDYSIIDKKRFTLRENVTEIRLSVFYYIA